MARIFCFNNCTNLFIFMHNLYVQSTCTFINKLNEISFIKIQGKQIRFDHLFSWPKTMLRLFWKWILFGLVINILVSSVNMIGIALGYMALDTSMLYTRNNNGTKFEPCGTPYFILVHYETVLTLRDELIIWTLWDLLWR